MQCTLYSVDCTTLQYTTLRHTATHCTIPLHSALHHSSPHAPHTFTPHTTTSLRTTQCHSTPHYITEYTAPWYSKRKPYYFHWAYNGALLIYPVSMIHCISVPSLLSSVQASRHRPGTGQPISQAHLTPGIQLRIECLFKVIHKRDVFLGQWYFTNIQQASH